MKQRDYRKKISLSETGPGDAGKTGSWRILRPVIDPQVCIPGRRNAPACYICWLYCPDGEISRTVPPGIDYQYCKGCGICAEECPTKAITMVEESSLLKE
ncbi:MAG TPA: 4Fe-4S binding protein [Deltaproteobacteria bacterium]|nr:4Fe-4S binding protein [Deltaproteobacteria bacterium]